MQELLNYLKVGPCTRTLADSFLQPVCIPEYETHCFYGTTQVILRHRVYVKKKYNKSKEKVTILSHHLEI